MKMHRWVAVAGMFAALVFAGGLQAEDGPGVVERAQAGHTAMPSSPAAERRLERMEVRTLGPAHAAEHALMRQRARDAAAASEPASAQASAVPASTDPADVGRWLPKFAIPGIAVHAVMLRTGKVLYFTGTTAGRAFLLDPVTQTTKAVYPPKIPGGEDEPANIFCAAQSLLDDGTVIVMGGTVGRREGLKTIFTFDPITETWRQRASMRHGRWYPTQVLLADGRTVVMDGLDEQGEPHVNPQIESYTPNIDFVTLLSVRGQTGQPPSGGLYPHLFQMPSGRVLVAGPEPTDSWFFSLSRIGALSWEDAPNPTRHTWGTGVLIPSGSTAGSTRVALIAGVDRDSLPDTGTSTPLAGVETFDEANPGAGWTPAPSLNVARAHLNTVLLPDRSMATVGGGYGILNGDRRSGDPAVHRNIELYDPATGQWTLGPAQDELRTYHSTALLLPDGRVLSAGDDGYGGSSNDTAEIYEPPYLFRGPRPAISSAPGEVTYGDTFTVQASADATKAVLMAPGAVTHANDMSQRHVPLAVTASGGGTLTVHAPASAALAPPTYYMLFVLNDSGVPSVAKFIRLKLGRENPPPDTLINSGPAPESQSASATFEFDSTPPGSTFECRRDGGAPAPCVSPWSYSGLSDGSHSFEVTAIDVHGKADPTPAVRSWTVQTSSTDYVAPETSIVSSPPLSTASSSATFRFSSSESGSSFACQLDEGDWTGCSAPITYPGLPAGLHTFDVRATDAAGNTDQSPASWEWAVTSPAAPVSEIVSSPGIGTGSTGTGATSAADSTPPRLDVSARRVVTRRRIVVEVACPTEPCATTAAGRILIAGAARSLNLRPVSAQLQRGVRTRLELRVSKSVSRMVRRALLKRKRIRVSLVLTARDSIGNRTTRRSTIRLRG